MAECRELEKKYYSCFPFLLQMAILYLNHATLSDAPLHIYEHCIELTQRIRSLSEDVNDAKEALTLEASCYLLIGEPMKAMELMDEKLRPISHDTELLAQVYQHWQYAGRHRRISGCHVSASYLSCQRSLHR